MSSKITRTLWYNILVSAEKRSLLCYRSTTLSSVAVKLTNSSGPLLEVKRNGLVQKKWHPSIKNWIDTIPNFKKKNLSIQFPSLPKSQMRNSQMS
jgi:hypothetical protein